MSGAAKGVLIFVVCLVVAFGIGAAIWAVEVGTSSVKGQGDAYRNKNSADNWVTKQKEFHRKYNYILSTDKNIGVAYLDKKANPKDAIKSENYLGLIRVCNDEVASYNSLSDEYDAAQFRDANLPYKIDSTDPQTDCKE